MQTISESHLDTAQAVACDRGAFLTKVIVSAAMPLFIGGIRIELGKALVGVVEACMFTALSGLGSTTTAYRNLFNIHSIFAPSLTLTG